MVNLQRGPLTRASSAHQKADGYWEGGSLAQLEEGCLIKSKVVEWLKHVLWRQGEVCLIRNSGIC